MTAWTLALVAGAAGVHALLCWRIIFPSYEACLAAFAPCAFATAKLAASGHAEGDEEEEEEEEDDGLTEEEEEEEEDPADCSDEEPEAAWRLVGDALDAAETLEQLSALEVCDEGGDHGTSTGEAEHLLECVSSFPVSCTACHA